MSVKRAKIGVGARRSLALAEALEEEIASEGVIPPPPAPRRKEEDTRPPHGAESAAREGEKHGKGRKKAEQTERIAEPAERKEGVESDGGRERPEMAAERHKGDGSPDRPAAVAPQAMTENARERKSEGVAAREEAPRVADTEPPAWSAAAAVRDIEALVRQVLDRGGRPGAEKKEDRQHALRRESRAAGVESRLRRLEMRLRMNRE